MCIRDSRKRVLPEAALRIAVEKKVAAPRDFPSALTRPGVRIIAEMKKASPSCGVIRSDFAPALLAADLEKAGATALSVLTEEDFFSGSLVDLKEASRVTSIPILRKDFILDPVSYTHLDVYKRQALRPATREKYHRPRLRRLAEKNRRRLRVFPILATDPG